MRSSPAEAGDGLAPVFPVEVGAALLAGDEFAVGDQAWAECAGDDFSVELDEPGRKFLGHRRVIVQAAVEARLATPIQVSGVDDASTLDSICGA